jgi:hypothetical protein
VARRELRRILVRSRRRLLATVAVALILAIGVFVLEDRRPALYERSVRVLLSEGAFAEDGRPRPRRELRAIIAQAIFAPDRLDALISEHDLVRKLGFASQAEARSGMRQLIEVDTEFDYFASSPKPLAPLGSARVTVTFSAPEPELALAVARDISELVAETRITSVDEAENSRIEAMRVSAENAIGKAVSLEAQLHRVRQLATALPSADAQRLMQRLSVVVEAAQERAKLAAAGLVDAQLQVHAVHRPRHLVQVVNPGDPFWRTRPRDERWLRQAILALLLAGIAAVILVGAIDPTVLDEHDLRRAGLAPLGRVPVPQAQSSRAEI